MSPLGKLNLQDIIHSVLNAVVVAVLYALGDIIKAKGLLLTQQDLQTILSLAISTVAGTLAVRMSSDHEGNPLGGMLKKK